jgi:TPR repeat protein
MEEAAIRYEAALPDFAEARTGLGRLYEAGAGVDRDYARAAELFESAADAGDCEGAYRLAFLYEAGLGVPYDPKLSMEWLLSAAQRKLNDEIRAARTEGDTARERLLREEGMNVADILRMIEEDPSNGLSDLVYELARWMEAEEGNAEEVADWYATARNLGNEEAARWLQQMR